MRIDDTHDLFFRPSTSVRYTFGLCISRFREIMGIQTGTAGCDDFSRNFFRVRLRDDEPRMYQYVLPTKLNVLHWKVHCYYLPYWMHRNVHQHGRVVPVINILREILTNVGGPHYFSIHVTSSALPLFVLPLGQTTTKRRC